MHKPCNPAKPGLVPAAIVMCSNYGTNAGNQPYQGQVVAPLTAGGVLQLKRIDQTGALTFQASTVEALRWLALRS